MPTSHHPTRLALLVLLAGNAWASAAGNVETPPPRQTEAVTYYIDGTAGDNQRSGTSPEEAWKDFTPINGTTLGPGERLLIKRGSIIRQELRISARGTADRWAEIGAYGEGPRPILRRDWDIADRCVWVTNPDYLRIRSLTLSYAAKSREFETVPKDDAPREYVVEMASVPGWKGTLKQLRLDLATGESLTGTCRFDYIAIAGGGQSP